MTKRTADEPLPEPLVDVDTEALDAIIDAEDDALLLLGTIQDYRALAAAARLDHDEAIEMGQSLAVALMQLAYRLTPVLVHDEMAPPVERALVRAA